MGGGDFGAQDVDPFFENAPHNWDFAGIGHCDGRTWTFSTPFAVSSSAQLFRWIIYQVLDGVATRDVKSAPVGTDRAADG